MIARRIASALAEDLGRKMVLLSGPRQCGKTTLVRGISEREGGAYLNWDSTRDRLAIQKRVLPLDERLWVFERRLPDIGRTQVRVVSAARLLANLP